MLHARLLYALAVLAAFGCAPSAAPPAAPATTPPAVPPAAPATASTADAVQPSAGGELSTADRGLVSARVLTVPPIGSFVVVDHEKKEINIGVLVVGVGADGFLAHVHAQTAKAGDEETVDTTLPGEAAMTYLPLTLGDIRGFRSMFHLYALGADQRLASAIAEMAPLAKGLIVVERRAGDSDAVVRLVVGKLSGPAVPVALVGADGLARRWSELGGPAPAFVGAANKESVFPALKSVAKGALSQLRSSGP
jgi:hypothetical protein